MKENYRQYFTYWEIPVSLVCTEENTGNSQCHQSADVTMKIQNLVQDHTNMFYRNALNKSPGLKFFGLEGGVFFQGRRLFHIIKNDKNMIINE